MDRIKVGVIGYGYWGPNLARNFFGLPSAQLAMISDLREERLKHAQSLYPDVKLTKQYQDFFDAGVGAVVISTPPATHFSIAKDCMEHGLHVLVEKPITLNSRDASELIELANQKGLTLMVGHTFEYNSAVLALKQYIQNGAIGQIYYLDTARLNLGLFQSDSNVLWDLAPHDISVLLYLLEETPISVSAQGSSCVFKGIFDVAHLNLIFPNNVRAHVHVSWLDPCKVRRVTVVGSKKMMVCNDVEAEQKIRIYDKGVEAPDYTDGFGEFQCSYRTGDITIPRIHFVEPLQQECKTFIDRCIQTQEKIKVGIGPLDERALENTSVSKNGNHCSVNPKCTNCQINDLEHYSCGYDGLRVVKILEAAQRSMMNGSTHEAITW